MKFLCGDKQFNEERVRNGAKKLHKARNTSTQGRLDSFFKVLPSSTPPKRKVILLKQNLILLFYISEFKSNKHIFFTHYYRQKKKRYQLKNRRQRVTNFAVKQSESNITNLIRMYSNANSILMSCIKHYFDTDFYIHVAHLFFTNLRKLQSKLVTV